VSRTVPFIKTQSIGNDFVLMMASDVEGLDWSALTEQMCEPRFGVGADSSLILQVESRQHLTLWMFNADGTPDFCGNGLRCAINYAWTQGWVDDSLSVTHHGREVGARIMALDEGIAGYPLPSPLPEGEGAISAVQNSSPQEVDFQLQSPSPGEGEVRGLRGQGAGSVDSSEHSSVHPPHPNPLPLGSGGEGAKFLPPPWGAGGFEGALATEKTGAGTAATPSVLIATTLGLASFEPADFPLAPGTGPMFMSDLDGQIVSSVSTGSAHTVIFVDELPTDPAFKPTSLALEHHPIFPERTSIMWTQVVGPDHLKLRIWERGVGETLGCGSGSTAAAAVYLRRENRGGRVQVDNPGGTVFVEADSWDEPMTICGRAYVTFEGEFPLG